MQLPKWKEFLKKITEFENQINNYVQNFKDNHPLLDKTIKESMVFFPPPFNTIAQNIYNNFEGKEIEKYQAVLGYLRNIHSQGRNHYEKIAIKLESLEFELEEIKDVAAKECTVQKIQNILISFGADSEQKFQELLETLGIVTSRLDKIEEKIDYNTELLKCFVQKHGITEKELTSFDLVTIKEEKKKEGEKLIQEREKLLEVIKTKHIPEPKNNETIEVIIGNFYYQTKNSEKALSYYRHMLDKNPDNVLALNNMGVVLDDVGKYEEALSYFKRALKHGPKNIIFMNNMGSCLNNLNRPEESLPYLNKVLEKIPNLEPVLYNKGTAYFLLGKFKEALEFAEKALETKSDDSKNLTLQGISLARLGKFEKAKDCFEKVLQNEPNNFEALTNMGAILLDLGDFSESILYNDKALKIKPEHQGTIKNNMKALSKLNQSKS